MTDSRRGFTMITTLWVMTVASIMVVAIELTAREAIDAARNRMLLERGFWVATGCAARVESALDELLGSATSVDSAAALWRVVDRVVPASLIESADCASTLEMAGSRIDLTTASEEMIGRALRTIGYSDEANAMVDAFEDWIDTDDIPRPSGAERAWYAANAREAPRNAMLADVRELHRIRGFESNPIFDSIFTTEPGRICLATSRIPVLMAIPGFTRETAERVAARAEFGQPIADPATILSLVSRESADSLAARFSEAVRVSTPDPDAWLLTVRATPQRAAIASRVRWRLVLRGSRVVATRTWQLP